MYHNHNDGHPSLQVIWSWWKISLRLDCKNAPPGQLRETHEDFLEDTCLQSMFLRHNKARLGVFKQGSITRSSRESMEVPEKEV